MIAHLKLNAITLSLLASASLAQVSVATLPQALATFTAVDANKDGRLSPEEMAVFQLSRMDARGVDADQDGFWSKEEFLLFYRQRLVAAGVKPAADLEAEVTRVLAARKARDTGKPEAGLSQTRRSALVGQTRPVEFGPTTDPLLQAFDQLQERAARGEPASAEFDRVREQLLLRSREADRAAKGDDPAAGEKSELHRKLMQSLDRLQTAAIAGTFPKEDYAKFREAIVHRARNAANLANGTAPAVSNGVADAAPSAEVLAIEKGLHEALDQLEKRAEGGGASHEDFQRVRDQLLARARTAANGESPAEIESRGQTYRRLAAALDRLEQSAREGVYSREEYKLLRESMVHRARTIDGGGPPSTTDESADATLLRVLDQLGKRVDAGQASHEDFQLVQDQLRARAQANAANSSDPGAVEESAMVRKLMQSLDRLDVASQNGTISKEEFVALKDSITRRVRNSVKESESTGTPVSNGATSSSTGNAVPTRNPPVDPNIPVGSPERPKPAASANDPAKSRFEAPATAPAVRPQPANTPEAEKPKPQHPAPQAGGTTESEKPKPQRPQTGGTPEPEKPKPQRPPQDR